MTRKRDYRVPDATGGGNSLEENPNISSMPRWTSNSVSFHVWTFHKVCPANPQTMSGLSGAPSGTHKSPKIVCGLRTHLVECPKLGKTQIIQNVRRGMVRNTGFYD